MGLFSSECKHCGSKEHSSSDCPHGIFSSKCKHCGSVEHSSSDCPHGIFSTKCKHCGSVDHSSDDCPHGIFSSKCKHCGSTEHSSSDCPHGIFSTKCKHCGSVNHSSSDCPHGIFATRENTSSSDDGGVSLIVYGVLFMIALAIVLYIAMIALFLSPLGLLIWYLIKKRKTQWIAIVGMLISAYLIYDISSGGLITDNLMHMRKDGSEKYVTLGYFVVLITTLGFFLDKYSANKVPVNENGNLFTKKDIKERRPLIAGFSILLLSIFSIFNFVDFSSNKPNNTYQKTKQQNITNTNSVNNNNNTTVKPKENSNKNNNTANVSNGELAVISDADGYTNLRKGKGTSYSIVKKILSNEKFEVFPSNEKWWKVKTNNGTIGYIFHNRVDLLNKKFYIINVTATKTETKALSEVKKLKNNGYKAGHLWIPNYKSLSGTNFYSVYIGPFSTQNECEREVEKYRKINNKAYGILVSQENKRVEIRGVGKVKIIEPYHK